MNLPAADRPTGQRPTSILEASEVARGAPLRWFRWRYVAAGLGVGTLVGAVTGLVAGLVLTAVFALDGGVGDGVGLVTMVLTLPLLGLVVGLFSGAVVGGPTGLVVGLTCSRITQERPARVAVALVTFVTGMLVSPLIFWFWGLMRDQDLGAGGLTPLGVVTVLAALALPCAAGAWLMARAVPSVLRHSPPARSVPITL